MSIGFSLSGIQAGLQRQATIANNIANLLTAGFRSRRAQQTTLAGGGTQLGATTLQLGAGGIMTTGDPLSGAGMGEGFLVLRDAGGGQAFTRAGNLQLNADGRLVTSNGQLLEPGIQVPDGTTDLQIARDGTVSGVVPGGTGRQTFGQLQIARFSNPAGLQAVGGTAFVATANSGAPQIGTATGGPTDAILGGFLEGSNVDLARELVDQQVNLRAVQANVAAFRAQDEALGTLLDIID